MLKFFRKIRRNLIGTGDIKRYLLYAIGEIGLVVIGILIALQINNWNTQRIERNHERQILLQLQKEYQDNKQQLLHKISLRNTMSTSAKKLLAYYELGLDKLNIDSLDSYLVYTLLRPTLDPALGVTNELTNSGKLYLIENEQLRTLISNWAGKYVSELKEEEFHLVSIVNEHFTFLLQHYQIRRSFEQMFSSEINNAIFFEDVQLEQRSYNSTRVKEDASNLFANDDFADYLASLVFFITSVNAQSEAVLIKIDEILLLIEQELNQ